MPLKHPYPLFFNKKQHTHKKKHIFVSQQKLIYFNHYLSLNAKQAENDHDISVFFLSYRYAFEVLSSSTHLSWSVAEK